MTIQYLNSGGAVANQGRVAKSGQIVSYADGDDGDIQAGMVQATPRFVLLGDTVLDNSTKLLWTKDVNPSGITMTWNAALDYCEALSLGGFSDWRMPNAVELFSLVDYANHDPALPTGHPFVGEELTLAGANFWTSNTMGGNESATWNEMIFQDHVISIFLAKGFTNTPAKVSSLYVWPVRGGVQ